MEANQRGKLFLENEALLIERAKTDEQAFEILYHFYFDKIYGYIFKRVGNREAAEDIVSITFTKVFCNLKNFKYQNCPFGAWVYKIATNNLIDYYRKESKVKEIGIDEVDAIYDQGATAEEAIQIKENRGLVNQILQKMSEKYKEAIHLKYFGEMSYEEMAQIMEISINNARVITYRALKNFKELYEKKYGK